ncbi:hypothetical protein [Streptomyces huasconensis]|uniref:hypothetical protein n=1 Tax=Streptomyces huasconensis TaxID=1854574 RepID=UPI0036FDB7D0
MSAEDEHSGPAAAGPEGKSGEAAQQPGAEGVAGEEQPEPDRPQNAWSARRDLRDHSPKHIKIGADARFGGSLVGGDQHGVSGGRVAGDVIMGSKTEIFHLGGSGPAHTSGEVPRATLERLAPYFVVDEALFGVLLRRLREERVLVISGPHFSGRRTAALMLLHRLQVSPVRTLVRDTSPGALAGQLGGDGQEAARGYLLCDLTTRRDQPLREPHLLAARDRLAEHDAYLVITVGPTAVLEDVPATPWQPPPAPAVLASHLSVLTDEERADEAMALPAVTEFLGRAHQLREVAAFAKLLQRYADGRADEEEVAHFSLAALESQVQEWFEGPDDSVTYSMSTTDDTYVHLRDKAFLVALAAFDGGPYALTAELSDLLYASLQKVQNPGVYPVVPVFGTHIGKRLQLARARNYLEDEHTEWGPVTQLKAAYRDERASLVLLREVWTGHPSARPALVSWLQRLADDGRPLVRTRAASTVAVLAFTDLPSAMALVIEVWAYSPKFRRRLVAANALALTHFLGTPNVPRILDAWCQGDDEGPAWVAIRAYALIGPERPEQTMAALRGAVRKRYEALQPDESGEPGEPGDAQDLMLAELAESVSLLLLSEAKERVLAELLRTLDDDQAVRDLALDGFLRACAHTEEDERYGRPLVLGWYAEAAAAGGSTARDIAALWRRALGDRGFTRPALDVLRDWVLIADRDRSTEWALAALLPALVTTATEHQRVSHLLRTMPGEDGAPPPPAAGRLLTVLMTRSV